MYNLGEHFKLETNPISKKESIILGKNYRFTILSPRLIRLEYSQDGIFNDEKTLLVINRDFETPKFNLKEDEKYLEITTDYFKLSYSKEKDFKGSFLNKMANLRIEISGSDRIWYYGHVEARNYNSDSVIIDEKIYTNKSLYSIEGFVTLDDSKTDILNSEGNVVPKENTNKDIYFFAYGKDFDLAIKDYYQLTGFPALLPRYALGTWWSRNDNYTDSTLKTLIDNFEENAIPLSVLILDKDWHIRKYEGKNHLKTGFTFNKDNFKAPYEMISYLHSKGIRIGLNVNPTEGLHDIDDNYNNAKKYLEADEKGIIPFNVLNPRLIDVYLKLYIHGLDALGVDFYFLDHFDDKKTKELFILKHYHFYDMMRDYKRRPMLLGYDAKIAQHRYPVLYSGKTLVGWNSLKRIPLYNNSASNLGISWWSHDIGGYFKGIEDNELYTRYVQLGTFSPILKFGADKGKYYKREPWKWSIKTLTIAKDYLQLRHKLIPYLYSEAYKYHKEGINLIKPIYYEKPEMYDDVNYSSQYHFGSQLFVSPIVNSKDYVMNRVVHKFYIPDGVWYDFFTGFKYHGNKNYVAFYKDQNYPVFAHAGSIVPLGYNDNLNDTTPPKHMEIHFFPGQSNEYKLYEDDGVSDLYLKDFYLLSSIDYNYLPNNYTVIIRALEGKSGIVPKTRNYKLIFRNTKRADEVIVYMNKETVPVKSYTEGSNFIVEVNDVSTIGQLTVNCKGKNIETDPIRLINDDVEDVISDLQIETEMKEKIDAILFSELPIKKKRIEIRRLGNKGLDKKFVKLFLRLLEYIGQV